MSGPVVRFYTRTGCHLCDDALAVLRARQEELGYTIEVRDVDANPAWREAYGEQVPVGVIDGRRIFKYRVHPARLAAAIRGRADP